MTAQLKPAVVTDTAAFLAMDDLICDIPLVARVLIHMSCSDSTIEGEEIAWIGRRLGDIGHELEKLYNKASGGDQ